jgi:hypothetical protein
MNIFTNSIVVNERINVCLDRTSTDSFRKTMFKEHGYLYIFRDTVRYENVC